MCVKNAHAQEIYFIKLIEINIKIDWNFVWKKISGISWHDGFNLFLIYFSQNIKQINFVPLYFVILMEIEKPITNCISVSITPALRNAYSRCFCNARRSCVTFDGIRARLPLSKLPIEPVRRPYWKFSFNEFSSVNIPHSFENNVLIFPTLSRE